MVTQGNGNGNYILAGKLMDLTTGRPLQGMKVFFTADSPIKINNQITNKEGIFSTNVLIAQGTGGTFKIQAHFDGLNQYDATDSKTIILKISAEKSEYDVWRSWFQKSGYFASCYVERGR